MLSSTEPERIDTLLALALMLDQESERASTSSSDEQDAGIEANSFRESFSDLKDEDRQALERRAQWYARLDRDKQAQWLAHRLARARAVPPPLDEHVHPSHVMQALRAEPPRVRQLILQHLPPALLVQLASVLGQPMLRTDTEPAPEIEALVRRVFLSNFVSAADLRRPIHLDRLSGVELVRLVRVLGVRETAVACRGIERAEMVGSFLRRLSAENARAIAAHMATLVQIEPRRVAFADQLVHEALSMEPAPEAMLDRLGMQVLAITIAMHEEAEMRAAYISQKLPLDAALGLREMVSDYAAREELEVMRMLAEEADGLTAGLQHAHARQRRSGAREEPHR